MGLIMKLLEKESLLKWISSKRDFLYNQYAIISGEIDNGCVDLDSKLSDQAQISYGIDVVSELIDLLDNCTFDFAEIKKDNIIIFDIRQKTFQDTYEYLSSHGVSAVALFSGEKTMCLEEKKNIINYLASLLTELQTPLK